jgi:imidazolonepropionase-like amidohydrolase
MFTASGRVDLVVSDVTVVDTGDGRLDPHRDVHIGNDRIAAVIAHGETEPPGGATVVDGAGRFVTPGFNDMHVHALGAANPSGSLELMLAYGITGFRQMSGSQEILRRRAAGTLLPESSPRLLATCGDLLTPLTAGTVKSALAAVRAQHDDGADFVKVALVTPEVLSAVQAEARRLGIPVGGHLPVGVDAD